MRLISLILVYIRLKNNKFIEIDWIYAIKLHILTLSQIATLFVTNRDTRHKLRHFQSQNATPSQNATITNCYVTRSWNKKESRIQLYGNRQNPIYHELSSGEDFKARKNELNLLKLLMHMYADDSCYLIQVIACSLFGAKPLTDTIRPLQPQEHVLNLLIHA